MSRWDKILLQGQLSLLIRISVSVPPPCYLSGTGKIPAILLKVQVAGYSSTHKYPTYVVSNNVTQTGALLSGVHKTRAETVAVARGTSHVNN